VLALTALPLIALASQAERDDRELRARIESRYEVVLLSDAVALRPKERRSDVRLIEVGDTISVNGVAVSGRELREKVGGDADAILRLSYLDGASRRALFADRATGEANPSAEAPTPPERPPVASPSSEPPSEPRGESRRMRAHGDRVRVFGDVRVREDEAVTGQVVAVLGSAYVDGEADDQVVAVLGNVHLGEKAVVRGDVVSVGGRVLRAAGAQVRGGVTEVAVGEGDWRHDLAPWVGGLGMLSLFGGFGAVPRLVGTAFRFGLLLLFASLAMVVARTSVERSAQRVSDNPVKATLVGLAAELLFLPMMVLTCIVLVLTIVGIPLLLLMPFVVLLAILLALVGFSGTALAVGQWARRRFNLGGTAGFLDMWLGIFVILLPVLVGRLIALGGFVVTPLSLLFVTAGVGVEFLAWSTGVGAILTNIFAKWQARRTVGAVVRGA
jgi:hypothetical protein